MEDILIYFVTGIVAFFCLPHIHIWHIKRKRYNSINLNLTPKEAKEAILVEDYDKAKELFKQTKGNKSFVRRFLKLTLQAWKISIKIELNSYK